MRRSLALTLVFFAAAISVSAQASWLDAKSVKQWNQAGRALPVAKSEFSEVNDNCKGSIRPATFPVDKMLTGKNWYLVGAAQVYGDLTAVEAAGGFDGNCRPMEYNVFVFLGTRLLGTLSPKMMQSREDGSLSDFQLWRDGINVVFTRYAAKDPFCCPSRTSSLYLSIANDTLKPGGEVVTEKLPK